MNPLGVCCDSLLTEFARISRHYQLALCSAIMQRNIRARTDDNENMDFSFLELPFDGIVESRSFEKVRTHYRVNVIELKESQPKRKRRLDESIFSDFGCSVSPKDPSHMLKLFMSSDCSGTEDEIMVMDFSL
jgi:hypothetical protein